MAFILFRGSLSRLKGLSAYFPWFFPSQSVPYNKRSSSSSSSLSKIRNVGIFAHIDAGKTTTTERMLYYSGFTPSVGEVHTGDTVMDYMDQERDRGITITSAAITFPWDNHQINLIDTPGHVDFTVEVERSLRVLDGGILILDASAGVQAQTLTVWRQAKRYSLPNIVFINKMDKHNANLIKSLDSLESKLNVRPLLTQYPIYGKKRGEFAGVVDLISMESVFWEQESLGKDFTKSPLTKVSAELYEKCSEKRIELIDSLCDFDDVLSTKLIEASSYDEISGTDLHVALKSINLDSNDASIVLLGSAYKNIGVQLLMDGISRYLPGPEASKSQDFQGIAFKIIHHPNKGALTFVRVYSGKLRAGETIYNVNQEKAERIQQLLIAFADDFHSVKEVTEGNIAVISGLKESVTGDTLTNNKSSATHKLIGVPVPNPVVYSTIEPPSLSQQLQLEHALKCLCREDPSLRVTMDEATGQTVLSGMGELHLSITRDRIQSEYKVDADLGSILIAYKETPMAEAEIMHEFVRNVENKSHKIVIGLVVRPLCREMGKTEPKLTWNATRNPSLNDLRHWQVKAIRKGFEFGVSSGPLISSSVVDAEFEITSVEISGRSKDTLIASAVSDSIKAVLKLAGVRLLEPVMKLEIFTDSSEVSKISRDIIMKRGIVNGEEEEPGSMKLIEATVPLAELKGYSQHLRTMTSGKANFGMELSHYHLVDLGSQDEVIQSVTGFLPR